MKKRGFGKNKWNGPGGKVEPGESLIDGAIRECQEEISVTPKGLEKVAQLHFYFPDGSPDWLVHVFECHEWEGEPTESEEVSPLWHSLDAIPYEEMWEDDIHWLPHTLNGKKVSAHFAFDETEKLLPESVKVEFTEVFSEK